MTPEQQAKFELGHVESLIKTLTERLADQSFCDSQEVQAVASWKAELARLTTRADRLRRQLRP